MCFFSEKDVFSFPANYLQLAGMRGSPVLDSWGDVVGMVFQSNSNLSFSVTSNRLKGFIMGRVGSRCSDFVRIKDCIKTEINNLKKQARSGSKLAQFQMAYMSSEEWWNDFIKESEKWGDRFVKKSNVVHGIHENWNSYGRTQLGHKDVVSIKTGKPYDPAEHTLRGDSLNYDYYQDPLLQFPKIRPLPDPVFNRKSFNRMLKAAQGGYVLAQYIAAVSFLNKDSGVEKDLKKAARWMLRAAEQGYSEAQYQLGDMYSRGAGVQQDFQKAFEWTFKAADQGHPEAQFQLGYMYLRGRGVSKKDSKKAFEWTFKAADQGHIEAQFSVGNMYFEGIGVVKNFQEAFKWRLKVAEQGHPEAQYIIGDMYLLGKGEVRQSSEEAFEWTLKAAMRGHREAQYRVGSMYYLGDGIEEINKRKAFNYWEHAAKQRHPIAQYNMGVYYFDGKMIPQNRALAIKYWTRAADQGYGVQFDQPGPCPAVWY